MPGTYKITYLQTGCIEQFCLTRGIYYELEDGSTLDVDTHIVWCGSCRRFTDGEWIRTPDELRRQILELRDPQSLAYKVSELNEHDVRSITGEEVIPGFREKLIRELKIRLQWRLNRSAPPKCISCGSTDIIAPLGDDDTEAAMDLPEIGPVRIESEGIASTEFVNRFFTPEGDRIPRATVPTYWGVPGADS